MVTFRLLILVSFKWSIRPALLRATFGHSARIATNVCPSWGEPEKIIWHTFRPNSPTCLLIQNLGSTLSLSDMCTPSSPSVKSNGITADSLKTRLNDWTWCLPPKLVYPAHPSLSPLYPPHTDRFSGPTFSPRTQCFSGPTFLPLHVFNWEGGESSGQPWRQTPRWHHLGNRPKWHQQPHSQNLFCCSCLFSSRCPSP